MKQPPPIRIASAATSLRLSAILSEPAINCHLAAENRDELIDELLGLLLPGHPELDAGRIKAAILDREAIFPTVIAPGLAVPHARLAELAEPLIAVGISKSGIDFSGSIAAAVKVNVVVLLLTPENNPGLHLQLLAALAQAFKPAEALPRLLELTEPAEVIVALANGHDNIPDFLKAGDLMDTRMTKLLESDTLRQAIHVFAVSGESDIPVLDDDGDLCGIVSTFDLLKLSFPAHLLWMENLAPINRFQPFADMLKTAGETRLADVMRDDYVAVERDLPAIQLAKLFIVNQINDIFVVDSKTLVGVVRLSDFCAKLFWS